MCDANFWKHIKVKGRENRPQDVSQDVRFEEMVILKWTEKKRKEKKNYQWSQTAQISSLQLSRMKHVVYPSLITFRVCCK